MSGFDVYSYGMISSSTLHLLDGEFPEADAYSEIRDTYKMIGGEAANSSIVLSRLGVKVKLDGNWLGKNENGLNTMRILDNFNIEASRLTMKENYRGVEEIVFADSHTRTNFGTYRQLLFTGKQWNTPSKEDIEASRIVCLDPFFRRDSALVAQYCMELSKPYVTIDCNYDEEIAQNAAVLIISGEYRKREHRNVPIEELFERYAKSVNGLIILTSGSSNLLYGRRNEAPQRFMPYQVETVDTAGAGDSFRSGILFGMLQGWRTEETINFASALAACICKSFPGVLNCPDYNGVLSFIENSGRRA